MPNANAEVEARKQAAAERALELVRPGTIVGLGTGSTARYFIEGLIQRVQAGLSVRAVVTSLETRRQAEAGGIEVVEQLVGSLGLALHSIPGVLEHALFFGIARAAIVAGASGTRILGELG